MFKGFKVTFNSLHYLHVCLIVSDALTAIIEPEGQRAIETRIDRFFIFSQRIQSETRLHFFTVISAKLFKVCGIYFSFLSTLSWRKGVM
jgi:hypothetical protein